MICSNTKNLLSFWATFTVNLTYSLFLGFNDNSILLVFPRFDTSHQLNPN